MDPDVVAMPVLSDADTADHHHSIKTGGDVPIDFDSWVNSGLCQFTTFRPASQSMTPFNNYITISVNVQYKIGVPGATIGRTILSNSLSLVGVARSLTDFQYCCALDKEARVFIDEDGVRLRC
jgi:hypothetical protein